MAKKKRTDQTVTLTIGLPGSGKTTWAKKEVADAANRGKIIVRVNNDDIREELNGGRMLEGQWNPKLESKVKVLRMEQVSEAIKDGYDVILDNTYLNHKALTAMRQWLQQTFPHVIILEKDFRDVSLDTCIERDKARQERGERFCGKAVIDKMAADANLVPVIPPYPVDWTLPWCIICDLDGTLAKFGNRRNAYDCSKCDETDEPDYSVLSILTMYYENAKQANADTYGFPIGFPTISKIFFFTGRTDNFQPQTERFLTNKCRLPITDDPILQLSMRKTGDSRHDDVVKKEMFDNHIKGHYNVLAVIDDRAKVVRMWRSMGLPVFDVGTGHEF